MRQLYLLIICILSFVFSNAQNNITYPGTAPAFCQGGQIILTASNAPAGNFQWKTAAAFAGPYTNTGTNSNTLVVAAAGYYTVSVTGNPVTFYDTILVTENPKPIAAFTFTNNSTCSGTPVQFTSTVSTGTAPFFYAWTFGDGNTSTQANPSNSFISLGCATGTFNVRLIVTDARGCRDTVNNTVSVLQRPDVRLADPDIFSPFSNCDNNPTPANPNFTLTVNNVTPNPSLGCITSYNLDWGDGSTVTGATFPLTHTYTQLGAFNLTVTAFGSNGCNTVRTYVVGNQTNPAGGLATLGATTGLCAPSPIPFVITNWENNSPGTIYRLDFGDGVIITLPHPLNATNTPHTVSHNYTMTSCPQATFTATLQVINACDTTPYTAGNIQVRISPIASFVALPNPGCAGQSVCFNNTTTAGSTGSNCSPATAYLWNFGDPASGANNTSTLTNPCHVYTTPGTYTVTLTSSNPCGPSVFTSQVCINQAPVPAFNINNATGCAPLAVAATNTTNSFGNCAATRWLWTVSYTPSNCGLASGWIFTNNTRDTSQNPRFLFNNPGTYLITLSAINPCGTFTSTRTVVVKQPPTVTLAAFPTTCGTVTITPAPVITNCGANPLTYSWSFPGGIPASSTAASPGTIVYSSAGNYLVTLEVTNECGTTTVTQPLVINPVPDLSIPISDTFCVGETAGPYAFTSSTTGATFAWTNSNTAIGLGASGSGNIPAFVTTNTTALSITGVVNVTASNGLCTVQQSFSVRVNPRPAAPVVITPVEYCQNAVAVALSANTGTGNTLLWYTVATGGSGSPTAPIPQTSALGTTIYYVSQVNTITGCEGARAAISVLVNPVPVISGSSSSNPLTCGSLTGTVTLAGLAPSTPYIVRYNFNSTPVTVTLSTNVSGTITIAGLGAGNYTGFYVELNNCPSNSVGPFTLADPNPPATPVVTGSNPICSGNTILLTASTTTPGVATYTWTGPGGYTSNQQNPTRPNATVAMSGNYVVTTTIANCVSAPATAIVVVNQTPAAPGVTSNSPVCTGNSLNLTAATSSPGAMTYVWTGPAAFTSTDQNPSIVNVTLANAGLYSVVFTSVTGNCSSAAGSTTVVINPTPAIANGMASNPTACGTATGFITLSGLSASTTYTINYNFNSAPQTTSATSNATGVLILPGLSDGLYDNIRVVLVGCTSNIVGPFVLSDPNPPAAPSITSSSPVCSGQSLNLSAVTASAGIASYNWTGPNGFNSGLQAPVLNNVGPSNAGYYYVTATINSCVSLRDSVLVVVNPVGNLPAVISPVNYCINTASVALTATANAGNTLSWYNVATGGTALPSAPVPSTLVTGTTSYYVSQTNGFGCEGPRSLINVTINPDARALFIPLDTMKCAPFLISTAIVGLQQFPANNNSYEWYANGVLIGAGTNFPGYTILNIDDSVTIKLKTISPFGCRADSMSRKFYTFKVPAPSFTLSDIVGCGPLSVSFVNTTAEINLYNYLWDFGNGQTSTLQQPGTVLFPTNPTYSDTVYRVKLRVASICDTVTFERVVRVKSKPRALFTPDRTTGCSPMRVLFTNNALGLNNTYYWNLGDGTTFITTNRDSFTHIYTTGVVDTFTVQLIAVNECGADTIRYLLVAAPNNIALNYSVNGPDNFGCAPHTVTFFNNSSGASTFEWNFGDGNTLSTTNNTQTILHTYTNAGTYTVTLTAINSCTDTTATRFITVYPKPDAAFVSNAYTVCVGQSIQLTNQSTNATTYAWNFGDGNTSVLVNPSHTYTAPGLYTIRLVSFRNNPSGDICIDTAFQQVQVRDTLPGLFSMSDSVSNCAPLTVTFVNRNRPSVSATWNFGDGSTASGDSVVHTFTLPGTFYVNLLVTVPGGCTYQSQDTVNVFGPSGSFVYDNGFVCGSSPVMFTAVASNAGSYLWNFGDGNTATTSSNIIYHTYANPGSYVPSVSLRNSGGCSFFIQGLDTIKVEKITAGFTSAAQQRCGSTAVQFTDTSFAFFGIASVDWRFGDGTTGTGNAINHTYTASNLYNVEMILTANSGCADTISTPVNIQVNSIPVASIIGDTARCAKEQVVFSANVVSKDPLTVQQWTLSNGVTATGPSFSYLFNLPGTYNLRFISGTAFGCFDTAFHTILIKPVPFITASNSLTICVGNSAQLNVTGASNYQWNPAQGLSCSSCANPIASPLVTTPYVVTAINSFGCAAYDTVVVTVIQPMNLTVSANDSICIGESANLLATGATTYAWNPGATLSSTTVANPVATPTITTSYRVVGYDGFNCFTDTAFVVVAVGRYPTITLGADLVLATGTLHPLVSAVTNGPIAQWLWSPAPNLDCATCPLPIATIKKDVSYIVKATTAYGCSASDTVNIKVFCEDSQVFVPNAFTPDGDGINDVLMVRGKGIVSVKFFRIFNRWGELVFERSNFPPNVANYGWNGKVKGINSTPDVFVYTAEVICENGTTYVYKGNTSIIK